MLRCYAVSPNASELRKWKGAAAGYEPLNSLALGLGGYEMKPPSTVLQPRSMPGIKGCGLDLLGHLA